MISRMRNIYSVGNMLVRRFKICTSETKVRLFKAYCSNVYGCSLWSRHRATSWKRIKVSHNDIFRSLLGVRRDASASQLFVNNQVDNLDVVVRKTRHSLMKRLENSPNSIIRALLSSEVRNHSEVWNRMQQSVGGANELWY